MLLFKLDYYLIVINYEKSLEATKKNYDSVLKGFEETKTRFDLGSATLYDFQEAQASFATVSTNLFASEKNFEISKKSFQRIVGLNAINLEDVLEINTLISLDQILYNALKENLNLHLLSNEIKNNEILILKEKKIL